MQLVLGVTLGIVLIFAGRALCGIMTDTKLVLDLCMVRISTVSICYAVLGVLNVIQESIRGIGYSFTSTLISVFANIILRLIYLYFVYPYICITGNLAHNLRMLYVLYPASWIISAVFATIILIVLFNRVKRRFVVEKIIEKDNRVDEREKIA